MENANLCNGCSGLKIELWPKDKQAARCMGHPGSWGYGRTLTVAEQGYIGRVYRPVWCMGKEGGEKTETMLDRLEREHPEFIGDEYPGGFAICPVDVGYERVTDCPWANKAAPWDTVSQAGCYNCWNRPIK